MRPGNGVGQKFVVQATGQRSDPSAFTYDYLSAPQITRVRSLLVATVCLFPGH